METATPRRINYLVTVRLERLYYNNIRPSRVTAQGVRVLSLSCIPPIQYSDIIDSLGKLFPI